MLGSVISGQFQSSLIWCRTPSPRWSSGQPVGWSAGDSCFSRDHWNDCWSKFSIYCSIYLAVIVLNCKCLKILLPLSFWKTIFHQPPNSALSKKRTIQSVVVIHFCCFIKLNTMFFIHLHILTASVQVVCQAFLCTSEQHVIFNSFLPSGF